MEISIDPFPVFLGIKLDPKLSYDSHLNFVKQKIAIKINTICKIKRLKLKNSTKIRLTVYKSMIRSIFDYCNVIYHVASQKFKTNLQKLQNKILRNIKSFPFKSSTTHIHQSLNVQTIEGKKIEKTLLSKTY